MKKICFLLTMVICQWAHARSIMDPTEIENLRRHLNAAMIVDELKCTSMMNGKVVANYSTRQKLLANLLFSPVRINSTSDGTLVSGLIDDETFQMSVEISAHARDVEDLSTSPSVKKVVINTFSKNYRNVNVGTSTSPARARQYSLRPYETIVCRKD